MMICNHDYLSTSEPVKLTGEGEYNLNVLKEIRVTESYLGLDQNIRGCHDEKIDKTESKRRLPLCSGLIVSSYFKPEITQQLDSLGPLDLEAYHTYKKWSFPSGMQGSVK